MPGGDATEKAKFISVILGIVLGILTFMKKLWDSALLRSIDLTTRETLSAVKGVHSNKPQPCASETKANADEGFRTLRAEPKETKGTAKDAEPHSNRMDEIPYTAFFQPRAPEKKPEERQAAAARKTTQPPRQSADLTKQAIGYRELAKRREAELKWKEAENYYLMEAGIAEKLGDTKRQAEICRELAKKCEDKLYWKEAESYYLMEAGIAKKLGDTKRQAEIYRELAKKCEDKLYWKEAESYYVKEAEIAERSGDTRRQAEIYRELSEKWQAKLRSREAEYYYLKALEIDEYN